jgi:hypothetical protein
MSSATELIHPPRRRVDVDALPLDDELVLFDPATGGAFAANATGSVIWDLCDGTCGVDTIAREIASRFAIPLCDASAGVRQFLDQAAGAGLLDTAA